MKRKISSLFAGLALLLASAACVSAATSTWTGGGTDAYWTTPGNWVTEIPGAGDDIVFPDVTSQTVDLGFGSFGIGTLTFNAPDAYSVANGTLTLGGEVTQGGAGAVMLDSTTDLGGASRLFNGTGSGVVTFNGPVTDAAAAGARVVLNAGNYVIANNANTIDRFEINSGATATIVGSGPIPFYPDASYFGGNGTGGGFYVKLDGGVLDFQATEEGDTPGWGTEPKTTTTFAAEWGSRSLVFGPNGGTLIWTNAPAGGGFGSSQGERTGPAVYYSQGGPGTIVVGVPLPYGDIFSDSNAFRSPFECEYGFALGIHQNSSLPYVDENPYLKWRQGEGDLTVVITNGACVTLDWNAMTNGNLIIKGQPGGDSSVIETDGTGWTRNVGRMCIRGPHRNGVQYSDDTLCPVGTITRSFYMNQPWGMQFHDAVQVWNRDGPERLACDMTFEPGSSVDFCSGRRAQFLDLGHPGNMALGQNGPTNKITIKNGASCNLNLQLRDAIRESGYDYGESAGLRVWSFIDIQDGGQLKIYRSQINAIGRTQSNDASKPASKAIELFRPITGYGKTVVDARFAVDLPWSPKNDYAKDAAGGNTGDNGVNFEANPSGFGGNWPGPNLIVNGGGRWGLRIEGKGDYLTNLLTTARLESLTGSGGVLTIAATDAVGSMTLSSGPIDGPVNVGLAFDGNPGFTYLLQPGSIANFGRLLVKKGRVQLDNGFTMTKNLRLGDDGAATVAVADGASISMAAVVLSGDATFELGTAGGNAATLNFANSTTTAWTAGKTLTIRNWNGNLEGGGPDQIFFGTDAAGLKEAQLAQIHWVAPNGGADVTGAQILSTGEIVPAAVTEPPTIAASAVQDGQFVFQVVAPSPSQISVVQRTTNLTTPILWENILTNTGTFNVTTSIVAPQAFYRVLVP